MGRAIIKQNTTDGSGGQQPCRPSVGGLSMIALCRLLARQAAREFLEHAGTDGAPREVVNEDRT